MKKYYTKPKVAHISSILGEGSNFSASSYKELYYKNRNTTFLKKYIKSNDKGFEPGSDNYIPFGNSLFIRISEMDSSSYVFSNTEETLKIKPEVNKSYVESGDICYQTASDVGNVNFYFGPKAFYNSHIRKLLFTEKKYYLFALLKSNFCKFQVESQGSIKGVDNFSEKKFNKVLIPFPTENNNQNPNNVEDLVSIIVQNIIDKEQQIREKNDRINRLIEMELKDNQKDVNCEFNYPKINEIKKRGRLDTGMYGKEFKKLDNLFKNYTKSKSFDLESDLKYDISRGQNLQISNIGRSYYSDTPKKGFYRLLISKNFNRLGGFTNFQYLGSKEKLKTIKAGDIIFSCRGNLGRVIIFNDNLDNTITNIDNVHIRKDGVQWYETTFIGLWLKYLENCGYFSKIAITGSGADSFTKYQFKELPILIFPEEKQKELANEYYNNQPKNYNLNFENYLELEKERNKRLGIFQLNMELFALREKLEDIIDKIIMEEPIEIIFDY